MNHAEQLRALARTIEDQPSAREAIAAGFRLVADAMEGKPCEDCTSQQGQALDPADNPEAGADTAPRQLTADESNAIGQAMAAAQAAPAGADLVDTATGQV